MSEVELKPMWGKRVQDSELTISYEELQLCFLRLRKLIKKERDPYKQDQMRQIKKGLKKLIGDNF
jgi:hypothetical protein